MSEQKRFPPDQIIAGIDNRSVTGVGGDLVLNAGGSQNGNSGSIRVGETGGAVIVTPPMFASHLAVGSQTYTTGTASQTGTIINGTGTVFTAGMKGGIIRFSTGQVSFISDVSSTTIMTSTTSQNVGRTTFMLYYGGTQLDSTSNANFQTITTTTIILPGSAKGDILAGDTKEFKNVSVGSNGQVLTADSAQNQGVKWATPVTAQAPASSQIVYVNKGGDDTKGTGSIDQPYLTIAQAMTSIADATNTKLYTVKVGAGDFSTENIALKPNIFIEGTGSSATFIGSITADGIFSTSSDSAGLSKCNVVDIDLTSPGTTTTSNIFYINNVFCQGNLDHITKYKDILYLTNVTVYNGTLNLDGSSGTALNCTLMAFAFVRTVATALSSFKFHYCDLPDFSPQNNTITTTGAPTINAEFVGCAFGDNSLTLSGASTNVFLDAISTPKKANFVPNNAVVSRKNDITGMAYTPATPGNWSGSPATLQAAIDRLAAQLYVIGGNTPIP